MATSTHTDYYQYSWETLVKPQTTSSPRATRLLVFGVVLFLLVSLTVSLTVFLELSTQETFWLGLSSLIIFVITALVFWSQVGGQAAKPQIRTYKINLEGLWVNERQVKFADLDLTKIRALVAAVELSNESMTSIKLPLKSRGNLQLHFEDEATYRRFIAALKNYVKEEK